MNHYGYQARAWWQANAPSRYAAMDDPEGYFAGLGVQVAAQVEAISRHLEASLPADLPYLEKVGQLRMIQRQAEEVAMADLVTWPPVEASDLREELGDMLGPLPGTQQIDDGLDWIQEQAEAQAEADHFPEVILDDLAQEDRAALLRLRTVVDLTLDQVYEMSEEEVAERVMALRPWMANNPAERGWHAEGPPPNPGWPTLPSPRTR